jgi:ABC-2 type transport system permease protein
LPQPFQQLVGFLPIKYLAYFPAAVFLGKIRGMQLAWDMLLLIAWTVFFYVLSRWVFARGVKRYSGFGG